MGKIISIVNPKGGIGKSTLTLCLCSLFNNSCIIDQDPQGSIWNWYIERKLIFNDQKNNDPRVEFYGNEELTPDILEDYVNRFTNVFIDCPGESEAGGKTRTALVYSDLVIIPVKESEFDANSLLDHLVPLLEDAAEANERGGQIVLLPAFVHPNASVEKTITKFDPLQQTTLQAVFRYRKVYEKFSENGQTLKEYSENARFVNDRIQAGAALDDLLEIVIQMVQFLK